MNQEIQAHAVTLKALFQQEAASEIYKPVYAEDITLTEKEVKQLLDKIKAEKAAQINSENYLRKLSQEKKYVTPTFPKLKKVLIDELETVYDWTIDEYNEQAIEILCRYFAMDGTFERMGSGFSFKKGFCLYGPVGCGKTTLMQVLARNTYNPYIVVSCRDVANAYANKDIGQQAIAMYSEIKTVNKREWLGNETVGVCFDDLGTESNKKNFGNELNVMAEIILNRYDSHLCKQKTHITTNLSADQIKAEYGTRVSSRMREMFNVVVFSNNSPDRRK
jgi:DNA replication protein DnaC